MAMLRIWYTTQVRGTVSGGNFLEHVVDVCAVDHGKEEPAEEGDHVELARRCESLQQEGI